MAKGMIVDDSKFMRNLIREALEIGGHEVVAEADNGSDAVDIYKKKKPGFITMDITMRGMDGIKAARKIKEIDPFAKIIVISALSVNTIRTIDPTAVISTCITKPFDKFELLNSINKVL